MPQTKTCRACQREILPQTPVPYCPHCLLSLGLEHDTVEAALDMADTQGFGDYELMEQIGRAGKPRRSSGVVACFALPFAQFLNPEICSDINLDSGNEVGQDLSYR